jgi:hypothetical protein
MQNKFSGTYPRNWDEIADSVKAAAGWRCVRCNHPHDPKAGRTLTVHHLNGAKNDCAWWNCPALCQVCHLVVQAKVVMSRNWMFDHSEWFRPYAAAYYGVQAGLLPATSDYFDSILLVRREFVETWLDYLLSLGKPQVIGA